jgi:hypothetical protein
MPALTGDVTTSAGAVATTIAAGAVSNAKLRNSAGRSVIGRSASTSGSPADIAAGANEVLREVSGTLGFGLLTGDNITDASVGYAKLDFGGAPNFVAGSDGSGNPTRLEIGADIAAATHTHDAADVVSGTLDRARLGSGATGGTAKFLREDSTWATPSGGSATPTIVNIDFGASPRQSGSLTFTIASSAVGSLVELFEVAETIVATGELADRLECDQVLAQGRVTASTTATIWWLSTPGPVSGIRRFAYRITPI